MVNILDKINNPWAIGYDAYCLKVPFDESESDEWKKGWQEAEKDLDYHSDPVQNNIQ